MTKESMVKTLQNLKKEIEQQIKNLELSWGSKRIAMRQKKQVTALACILGYFVEPDRRED